MADSGKPKTEFRSSKTISRNELMNKEIIIFRYQNPSLWILLSKICLRKSKTFFHWTDMVNIDL